MKEFLRSRSSRGFGKFTGYCRDKIDGRYLVRSRMMVGFSLGFFGQIICDMFEFYIYKTVTVWRMCLKSSLDGEARFGVILRRVREGSSSMWDCHGEGVFESLVDVR